MNLTLTHDWDRIFLAVWAALITGLVIKTRLELRAHQAQKPNAPLPVDPVNPPTKGVFARETEDPEILCYCHGNPICDGQDVVSWPQPPRYTCSDTDEGSSR
ncbi:hypothetical protein OG497_38170 [Streptomyces sp. NBC_01242]|uniref:hypothetical protein n=1 Tax=Streptomyces sp. NBC_01242 TaxID=2903795 RepID=UPI00225511DD|nr:hypothetical protein [Streptomyces sp. NBC_01242]MCX4799687.1 hypothetical protein [Streptomyces sp. NBC_01242]